MQLTNRVALVTGGTKGIGAATAVALARAGADGAIVGRHDDDEARATCAALGEIGRRSAMIVADCGQPSEAARCVADAEQRLGKVDVLVHSAGGPVNGGLFDLTPEDWQRA